ncbi:MAG TPA: hypothetical protein VHT49_07960, partial [Acidimicrobiales bacterium]|nr:hypothetical protein [Acidimicrobiales bacterium]
MVAATVLTKAGLQGYKNSAAQMDEDVRICKMTHTNKNCVSCHSGSPSSAALTMPKGVNIIPQEPTK